ncbi:hypothetical protein [Burkholderia sp. RF4-BP95]|uniref:hypothetical protein n=1 Tax=Burkholderia sp. RF4-BP95 TaxID=1637845 RepID=UPI0012E39CC5|nr:hypothetical protein [Burkholderia sp. RF4-BP95]
MFCAARETSISDNESRIAAQDATARKRAVATADSTSSRSMQWRPVAAIRRMAGAKLLIEQQRISNADSVGSSHCGISMRCGWRNAFHGWLFGRESFDRWAIE